MVVIVCGSAQFAVVDHEDIAVAALQRGVGRYLSLEVNMSKPRGRCVFCGGTGLSKQHIYSKWIQGVVETGDAMSGQLATTIDGVQTDHVTIEPRISTRQGASHIRQIRNVCAVNCNNGWMKGIEEASRPLLPALVKGADITLGPDAQKRLASWLTLVAMMAEFTDPKTVTIPQADRIYLMGHKKPPDNWTILIGRYEGKSWAPSRYSHRALGIVPAPAVQNVRSIPFNTQVTTQVLGKLFIHICSSEVFKLNSLGFVPVLHPVWPVGPEIRWPTQEVIDDARAQYFADALVLALAPRRGAYPI